MAGVITIKIVIVVLLLLSSCCSTVSAASIDLGITDALSNIVSKGIENFWVRMADACYSQSFRPDGHTFNGTGSEVFIYAMTTQTVDPWNNIAVMKYRTKGIILAILYGSVYSVIGFVYALISILSPCGGNLIDGVLNRSNSYRMIRIKEYFENLLTWILVIGFTDIFVKMMFLINYFICSFLIVSSYAISPITPSADNIISYVSMGIMYLAMSWFMCCRGMLLYLFVMGSFIIGALLISNKTRDLGFSIGYYFTGILYLQTIIVFCTTGGYLAIEAMKEELGIVAGSIMEIGLYIILTFILLVVAIVIVFGLKHYKKTAINTMRLVI